jgi:hypothetical protein
LISISRGVAERHADMRVKVAMNPIAPVHDSPDREVKSKAGVEANGSATLVPL